MKIVQKEMYELNYDEITNEVEDVAEGDIVLTKSNNSEEGWQAQFVVSVTNMGIYLHSEDDGAGDCNIILWPEHLQSRNRHDNSKFIHISIRKNVR